MTLPTSLAHRKHSIRCHAKLYKRETPCCVPGAHQAGVDDCSTFEASRFLKAAAWRLEPALDAFYNDPLAVATAEAHREASSGGGAAKKLEALWDKYSGELSPSVLSDLIAGRM